MSTATQPVHGGPDAQGVPLWDFSTNANACGPCPMALAALAQADAQHYPDPAYTHLRSAIADFHGVSAKRIVLAGSASEFIARISAAVVRSDGQTVWLPPQAYGDYARAAAAWGLQRVADTAAADLLWLCEPSSPQGAIEPLAQAVATQGGVVVLDRAYEPLRLAGRCSLDAATLNTVWQLWSPNKALALTGVRGAYAIAPLGTGALLATLESLSPSWPLGAHAVAMISAWVKPETQAWLAQSREQLRGWKTQQLALLSSLGWVSLPSDANYLCAKASGPLNVAGLRAQGIKLRDTTSMGLLGHWRLSVQPPVAQAALAAALKNQQKAMA